MNNEKLIEMCSYVMSGGVEGDSSSKQVDSIMSNINENELHPEYPRAQFQGILNEKEFSVLVCVNKDESGEILFIFELSGDEAKLIGHIESSLLRSNPTIVSKCGYSIEEFDQIIQMIKDAKRPGTGNKYDPVAVMEDGKQVPIEDVAGYSKNEVEDF